MLLQDKEFNLSSEDLQRVYIDKTFKKIPVKTPSVIKNLYGEFFWLPFSNEREIPYLYGSLIQTLNGRLYLNDQRANGVSLLNSCQMKGHDVDFWILNILRFYSEAVIVGSETLRKQPYLTSHIWDKRLVHLRNISDGKVPIHIIITETGLLNTSSKVLKEDKIPLILLTTPSGLLSLKKLSQRPIKIISLRPSKQFLKKALKDYIIIFVVETTRKQEIIIDFFKDLFFNGIQKILVESPTLINYLIQWQMLDEIFLATNNILIGKGKKSSYSFSLDVKNHIPHAKLMTLHHSKGFYLFSRYRFIY